MTVMLTPGEGLANRWASRADNQRWSGGAGDGLPEEGWPASGPDE